MCPSAHRVCSESGGKKPVLSLSLDRIKKYTLVYRSFNTLGSRWNCIHLKKITFILQGKIIIFWQKFHWNLFSRVSMNNKLALVQCSRKGQALVLTEDRVVYWSTHASLRLEACGLVFKSPLEKLSVILQAIFSNAILWMKNFVFD